MKASIEKRPQKKAAKKAANVLRKMLDDKRLISQHISKGGSFEELEKKGYHFATV